MFFEYFDSLNKIFDSIRVVDIEERNICDELSNVSSVRLALMCMNYQYEKKIWDLLQILRTMVLLYLEARYRKKHLRI